jgi:hypothetical protein
LGQRKDEATAIADLKFEISEGRKADRSNGERANRHEAAHDGEKPKGKNANWNAGGSC